jgi:hypothetical protein
LLTDSCSSTHEVASSEDAHVFDGDATVGERSKRSLGSKIDNVLVRMLSELGHVDAENPNVIVCHCQSPQLTGSKP